MRLVKDCPALQTVQTVTGFEEDRYRALWRCAHLPLPPKSFRLREQDRVAYVRNGAVTSTRRVGLDWMMVSHRDGGREQTVMFEECAGAGRRWDVFYSESP